MLKIENLKKVYGAGENQVEALKDINLSFNAHEFVSILGPSGCGKTTLLNIIGGLDRYSSGNITIDGISTKDYKDSEWDSYRNHKIGFVFQSYHLISHLSVIENVELALTLSGYDKATRQKKAKAVLERVGLSDQAYKRPNQLSGGQAQRVAIARALVNDPTIILADEPTGALDTKTSKQVMSLLQEISKDKLIIMVTHNNQIAYEYSDRIIELLDGKLVSDSKNERVTTVHSDDKDVPITKTSMSFVTAFKLSLKNLFTKKVRTIITAIAGSIGIIGVGLVLAMNQGVNNYLDTMQKDSLAGYPLTIEEKFVDISSVIEDSQKITDYDISKIYANTTSLEGYNNITRAFIDNQVLTVDSSNYSNLVMKYGIMHHFVLKTNMLGVESYYKTETNGNRSTSHPINSMIYESVLDHKTFDAQFQKIYGEAPKEADVNSEYIEAVIFVDQQNRLPQTMISFLGFGTDLEIDIDEFFNGIEDNFNFKLIMQNALYQKNAQGKYETLGVNSSATDPFPNSASNKPLYDSTQSKPVKIVGIYKAKEGSGIRSSAGVVYFNDVESILMENAKTSNIMIDQLALGNASVHNDLSRETVLRQVGGYTSDETPEQLPTKISFYPVSFEAKNAIRAHFDAYNETITVQSDKITYIDNAELVISLIGEMVNVMTYVLVAFASISLIVSSVMIGIITYVSVVERTKEIGILRSLGARKKDISRVFNVETLIIGLTAGVIGSLVVAILSPLVSAILYNQANIKNLVTFTLIHAGALITISALLTFIAGLFPSRIASLKDPVVALRTEQ